MGYVKLERHSDWGNVYLTLPGKGLSHGAANAKLGIKLSDGDKVHIAWPDGSQSLEPIVYQKETSQVSDMGRTSSVSYSLPGVRVEIRGLKFWVSLADVLVLEEDILTKDQK